MMQAIRWVILTTLVLLSTLPGLLPATTMPVLQGRVNDDAHVLGDRQAALEARLAAHESSSGDQVVVLTVPDLGGKDIESYANDVFKQWRLGHKGVDNGVLMVVSVRDRRARIEVGYGLEGQLTDVASSQILRYRMHPRFAVGDYAGGVEAGIDGVLAALDGAAATPPAVSDETPDDIIAREGFWKSGAWMLPLMVALFTLLFAGWLRSAVAGGCTYCSGRFASRCCYCCGRGRSWRLHSRSICWRWHAGAVAVCNATISRWPPVPARTLPRGLRVDASGPRSKPRYLPGRLPGGRYCCGLGRLQPARASVRAEPRPIVRMASALPTRLLFPHRRLRRIFRATAAVRAAAALPIAGSSREVRDIREWRGPLPAWPRSSCR